MGEPLAVRPTVRPAVRLEVTPAGHTRVELLLGERPVSRLTLVPFTLRVGGALVRMDGIAGVGTDEDCRRQGYSRLVLEEAVRRMRQGDAALSMLYGIPDFYPKFGFAIAGPDHLISLVGAAAQGPLPSGWKVRPFAEGDLPGVKSLYERSTATATGAAIRIAEGRAWQRLRKLTEPGGTDACRIVESRNGQIAAYAWRGKGHWCANQLEQREPGAFVLGEVLASNAASADAILAVCRSWAAEQAEPPKQVLISAPPEGPVAAAALRQSASFVRYCVPCGGSMARVLSVTGLLGALIPELNRRLQGARSTFAGRMLVRTDIGAAALRITPDAVTLGAAAEEREGDLVLAIGQADLARLALGALPPDDVLDRQPAPVGADTRRLAAILFPERHPHLYLPDRF